MLTLATIQAYQSYTVLLSLKEIDNSILCSLDATTKQIYWQELSVDKNILFSSDL